jgi:PAS domain S-box-containing protein
MSTPDSPRTPARAPDRAAVLAQACGLLTVGIGVSALIGWTAGIVALHSVSTAFVPTAPSTALSLVLLGAAAFALDRWPERRAARWYVDAAAILACAFTALVIAQFVGGFDVGLEPAVSSPATALAGVPVGRMSALAAGGFLLAALSLIALTTYPSETAAGRRVAVGMGLGTLAIGVASLAGYALHAPLLYHSSVVPVALPTAGGLSLLGVGILTSALRTPRPGAPGGAEARQHRRPSIMRYIPAAFGAGAMALLTVVAAGIARQLDQTRLQGEFEAKAKTVALALQADIDEGLTNVRSVAAAIAIDEVVTRSEFRLFAAASRPLHGGAIAVAWVPSVPGEARARFEAAARRDGRPDFRVTERGPAGRLVAAGRRNEYLPVLYVEPSADLGRLLGFDVGTEPAAADALTRARDADATVVSDGFHLVTDPPGQVTIVITHPLFHTPPRSAFAERGALQGYAVGILRFTNVVRAVEPRLDSQGIALTVRDVRQGAPKPVYGRPEAAPAHLFLSHAETLAVADRRWQAVFVPTAAYASLHPRWSAWALLAAGLLFAFLVGAHLFGMEGYASDLETARETLHTSEARFRAISESAVDGIITIDAHGAIVHCNAAAARAFGYEDGSLVGRNVRDLVPASHLAAHAAGLEAYRATGQTLIVGESLELPALRRDGSEFPIDLSLATWETHEGRFATAIVRDISDRRQAQAERERLIAELQDALASVKSLRGLLPVCSWCRKVLDDRGAWRQLEAYVHEHTDADFSHGICPECAKKYLSEDG